MIVTFIPLDTTIVHTLVDDGWAFYNFSTQPYSLEAVVPIISATTPKLHDRKNALSVVTFTTEETQASGNEKADLTFVQKRVLNYAHWLPRRGSVCFEYEDGSSKDYIETALVKVTDIRQRGVTEVKTFQIKGWVEEDVPPAFQT